MRVERAIDVPQTKAIWLSAAKFLGTVAFLAAMSSIVVPILFAQEESVLHEDRFEQAADDVPEDWWLEGGAVGARAWVEDGRLWAKSDEALKQVATLWLNKPFRGDLELSFDVHVVDSLEGVNNMNLFFLFRGPDGGSIFPSRDERADAGYTHYHGSTIKGYVVTFVANEGNEDEARIRLRRSPPFQPPVRQFFGYEARSGKTYKIRVRKADNRIQYFVDDNKFIDAEVEPVGDESEAGYIGFRTFQTQLWWDNVVIKRIRSSPDIAPFPPRP